MFTSVRVPPDGMQFPRLKSYLASPVKPLRVHGRLYVPQGKRDKQEKERKKKGKRTGKDKAVS
jgi:hypothetical protein